MNPVVRDRNRHKLPSTLVALVLGVVGISLCCRDDVGLASETLLGSLKAADLQRLFEPQLTIGFEYHPCSPISSEDSLVPRQRCAEAPALDSPEVAGLLRRGRALRGRRPQDLGVEDQHGLAIWHMLWLEPSGGSSRRLERAILLLQDAVAQSAGNAGRYLSDLSAAFILRAQRRNDPFDLISALEAAVRAQESDPDLKMARFNFALALTLLHLERPATEAWRAYLEFERDELWAAEARRRIDGLLASSRAQRWAIVETELLASNAESDVNHLRELVVLCPQCAREFALERLLVAWATIEPVSVKAGRLLATARSLGEILLDVSGDAMVYESVELIDRTLSGGDERHLELLRSGHRVYEQGRRLFDRLEMVRATTHLREARSQLARAGSPLVHWVDVWLAGVLIHDAEYAAAEAVFEEVARSVDRTRHAALVGKLEWGRILIRGRLGRYADALTSSTAAAQHFGQAGEAGNLGAVLGLQAELFDVLGRPKEAWRSRYLALGELSKHPEPRRLHNLLRDAASAALDLGYPRAALALQDEGVGAAALQPNNPQMTSEALLWRGKIRHGLGDAAGSLADLQAARTANAQISDSGTRERNLASIQHSEGQVLAHEQPTVALSRLAEAISFFESKELALNLSDAYLAHARVNCAMGLHAACEADLRLGIELFEQQRANLLAEDLRRDHLQRGQALFDAMISLQAERGQPALALYYSESAREILPASRPGTWRSTTRLPEDAPVPSAFENDPSGLDQWPYVARLPADLTVIEYALLDDRLLIWTLNLAGMKMFEQTIDHQILRGRVRRFLDHLRQDGLTPQAADLSSGLHDVLLAPVLAEIGERSNLVVVADKFLNQIPFAALRNRATGRFLIQDRAVTVAPSVEPVLANLGLGSVRSLQSASLLAVNPTFDRERFAFLSPLSGTNRAKLAVVELYDQALHLDGEEATESRFLMELPKYQIVQFSGHAVYNAERPPWTYLLFAPGPGKADDGALHAHELQGVQLNDLRLIILAACDTLSSGELRTEGLSALARPFLSAGADAVLGSLWPVDDIGTDHLLMAFHENLADGEQPSQALRHAQVSLIDHSDPVTSSARTWAAFQLVGASQTRVHPDP